MATITKNFTKIPDAILTDRTLDVNCKVLAACLLHFAREKDSCFPSQETLASYLGCSVDTVHRHLNHLKSKGLVVPHRKALDRQRRAGVVNQYDVRELQKYVATKTAGVRLRSKASGGDECGTDAVLVPDQSRSSTANQGRTDAVLSRYIEKDTASSMACSKSKDTGAPSSREPSHDQSMRLGIAPPGADAEWAYDRLGTLACEWPPDNTVRSWIALYGEDQFVRAVELLELRSRKIKIEHPIRWVVAAMKGNYQPNPSDLTVDSAPMTPCISDMADGRVTVFETPAQSALEQAVEDDNDLRALEKLFPAKNGTTPDEIDELHSRQSERRKRCGYGLPAHERTEAHYTASMNALRP